MLNSLISSDDFIFHLQENNISISKNGTRFSKWTTYIIFNQSYSIAYIFSCIIMEIYRFFVSTARNCKPQYLYLNEEKNYDVCLIDWWNNY